MFRDIRYALRSLARRPAVALAAAATLAIGIGANTAIFSAVQATLLRPLPYPDPERLVMVWEVNPREQPNVVNPGNFMAWMEQSTRLSSLAGYVIAQRSFSHDGRAERVRFGLATAGLFDTLGVSAIRGRVFETEDATPERGNALLISEGFWQRRFGRSPDVIGSSATIGGRPATIVGVVPRLTLPRSIDASTDTEVWAVVPLDERTRAQTGRWMQVVGRLAPGATVGEARAEIQSIAARLADERPEFNGGWGASVEPFHSDLVKDVRGVLVALTGAVGVLLLIACVNVASLMLAQALAREREIAVRAAIGAGAGRLVRQLLTESLVLSALGAGLGLLLGTWMLQALLALLPSELPLVAGARLDAGVLAFTAGLSLLAALVFGLLPALRAIRVPLVGALKEGAATAAAGRRRSGLRNALVVAEVALALVLLVGAGLVVRSFQRLSDVDPGFRAAGALSFAVTLPQAGYPETEDTLRYFDEALGRLGSVPGVAAAGAISWRPLGTGSATSFRALDRPAPEPGQEPVAAVRIVRGDLFGALDIPLLRGRALGASDAAGAPTVVVVNQGLADELWPGGDAVGRRLAMSWGEEIEAEVVGVVGDVRLGALDTEPGPTLYWSQAQVPTNQMTFVVRTPLPATAIADPLRRAVAQIDSAAPVSPVETLEQVVSASLGAPRFLLVLLGVFAATAALLAAVGLYGVVSFGVEQRRAEIGVRLALGADAGRLQALVLRDGLRLAALGVALGLPAAFAASRLLESQLFETSPTDPVSYAAVSLLLLAIAGVAALLPARRATRVDPLEALRVE